MEIEKKIANLEKSISSIDELVDILIAKLKSQQIKVQNKENEIVRLKHEIGNNVKKIDKIIEDYNANI
tara:strand:+ start:249 stop:452 length:204 start_codon:yes stop_codon:yes gene_type:complete